MADILAFVSGFAFYECTDNESARCVELERKSRVFEFLKDNPRITVKGIMDLNKVGISFTTSCMRANCKIEKTMVKGVCDSTPCGTLCT
jgi:hypothetical protein